MSQSSAANTSDRAGAPFDPKPAGALIAQNWRAGTQFPEIPANVRPSNMAEGYDVQDAAFAEIKEKRGGWKVGNGSPNGQRAAKIDRPTAGQLPSSRILAGGSTLKLPGTGPFTVEFEIGFYLEQDITPDTKITSIKEAVSATHVTFEFVHSRYVNRKVVGLASSIADSISFGGLVVGESIDPESIGEVFKSVVVLVDGVEKAVAVQGDDVSDPWEALEFLIEHAQARGITLKKGEIVSTGSVTKPFEVSERNVEISARYLDKTLSARVL
jgi:2-keto-4-pentenoate hydratase